VIVVVAMVGLASWGVVTTAVQRKQTVAAANVSSRLYFWQVAVDEFQSAPFTGVGPGNYTVRFTDFAPPFSFSKGVQTTHNAYLNVLAELGIGGFLTFAAYLVASWATMRIRLGSNSSLSGLRTATCAGFLVALVGAFFLTEQFYSPLWFLPALAMGVGRLAATVDAG
jgi:O-antigen ligase